MKIAGNSCFESGKLELYDFWVSGVDQQCHELAIRSYIQSYTKRQLITIAISESLATQYNYIATD